MQTRVELVIFVAEIYTATLHEPPAAAAVVIGVRVCRGMYNSLVMIRLKLCMNSGR